MSDPLPRMSSLSVFRAESSSAPPDPPADRPPSEWRAGSERLREQVRRLRGRVEEQRHALLDAIEQDLYAPLQSAAHEAAAVHTALVKTSHFDEPADALPSDVRWKRVRDYRRDTIRRVIAPLRKRLAALDPGTALNDRWQAFWEDLASLPPRLPVSITRVEPETLYALAPKDSLLVVLRKRLVQVRRQFQIGPQPTSDGQFYAQEVPLRKLAAYHLRVRLPERLGEHERAIYQDLARAVAAFERAVTTWTHRLLDAERLLDRPDHHHPTSAPTVRRSPETAIPTDATSPADAWTAVGAEARALTKQLRTLAELRLDERPAQISTVAREAWSDFEADLEQAGSFLLRRKDRALPAAPLPAPHHGDAATQWAAWHRQAADRLAFCDALATLHDATYEQQDALLHALAEAGLKPLLTCHTEVADRLQALHDEVDALFSDASTSSLAAQLGEPFDRAARLVDDELVTALQHTRPTHRAREALDEHLAALTRRLTADTAEFQLHALAPSAADVVTPNPETRTLSLSALVHEYFDAFFTDTLQEAVRPFFRQLEDVIREHENVPRILHFNLNAALEEARNAAPDDEEALASARELALNGLARSIDVLNTQAERARSALPPLVTAVSDAFDTAWTHLHDRARAESRIREHLLDLRAFVARERQEATERAERHVRRAQLHLQRTLQRGQDHATELLQRGQSAVGARSVDETALLDTLDALARVDQVLAGLPLVYRRLFSTQPVLDPTLLVGRDDDLARVQHHLDQWRRGLRNAMVVTGPPGSGRTSFLNVVQKTMLHDAEVHTLKLDRRLSTEAAFAEQLARALNLPTATDDGTPLTLDDVRRHLTAQPRPDAPRVCFLGPLEHLFLRSVNGTRLVERVLTFMSRTDAQVLWIATASEHGWQQLEKTVSVASSLVRPHRLTALDRSALETLILIRHRRSGLPLAFDPPEEPSPLLRRRLRKARTHERRQAVLQAAYFDRLHALCGSNVVLALFYWIRSVHLDDDPLVMRVRPLEPLDFRFLDTLPLPQAFLLKALLDHATLTVDEYSTVAHASSDTCLALFESLANMLLLQPADAPPDGTPFASIEPDRRYRLRPLVVRPVMEALRGKNILH